MSASLEAKNRTQATLITIGFAISTILLMILLKWKLPEFIKTIYEPGIEVELNMADEPELLAAGGGGGGNPVQAAGIAGIADYTPPTPGENLNSKDIEDFNDHNSPAITKPVVSKPKATTITNTSVAKAEPRPVVEVPAPKVPKAVLGKTTTGTGRGGGAADDYDKAGGSGTGSGVGNGSGTGGGSGTGNGGGNGSGSGSGSGPKVMGGDRKIIRHYSFQGDMEKATIYANISVSPEGNGRFVSIARGSSSSNNAYKTAIMQYLQNIRFDKSDHESMVTVRFNFEVN